MDQYNLITTYGYDEFGRQNAITDTLGHVTFTEFDDAGRVYRTIVNAVDTDTDGDYTDESFNSSFPDQNIITEFVYEANGNLRQTIEFPDTPALKRISYTVYDDLNRVEKTIENYVNGPSSPSTEPDEDLITAFEYDDVGNQKVITDTLGRPTMYDYDALNRVITITNPLDGETGYGYDLAGNRTSVTDAEGRETTFAYDELNRVVTTTNELGGETVVAYDAVGNRTHTIDANTHVTTFTYDSLYRLTQTTDAENQDTTTSYDALGNRLTMTDAEGTIAKFEYDTLNRLITTTMNYVQAGPSDGDTNVSTVVAYDALSRRTATTDGRDNPTSFGYDMLGRTIAITDALLHVTETTYDGRGNRRFVTNAEAETTEFQYDDVDRLIKTIDPLTDTTTFVYNKGGERTAMIDAEVVTTTYTYDDLSRLIKVIENYVDGTQGTSVDEDLTTRYGYDAVGNRTVITNARGYTTTFAYDGLNRRISTTDALGNVTEFGYDAVGNRTVITDANSIETTFIYDKVNRLTGIDYSDSTPDVTFTYDKVGNRQTMDDGTGGTTTYSYDDLYRLSNVNDGAGDDVGYTYDEVGNRKTLTYPDSKSVTYSYDDANRLDTVSASWISGQFGYTFDDANRMANLTLPNAVTSTYSYDDAGRLTRLAHTNITETLASYAYGMDNVGNRTTLTETLVTVDNLPDDTFLESDGLVVMEGEHYFGELIDGDTHNWLLKTSVPGYTGTSYLQTSLDIDVLYQTNELTASPRADYLVNITTPETYTVWLRGYPNNAASDSAYVGVDPDGQVVAVTGFSPGEWSWANIKLDSAPATMTITSTGLYTISLWMREDGLRIDRLLLTTDTTYVPTGEGPAESPQIGPGVPPPAMTITRTIVYTYDNLYRLTDADYSTGEAYDYEYDAVGNRLKQIIDSDTTDYLYDAANRLEKLNNQVVYTFDDNGNLLNSGTLTNTFDAANRLTSSVRNSGVTVEPIYNGVSDRVGQVTAGVTTTFALDIANGLPEVIYTSQGNAYLHLPGVIVAESSTGETHYLLSDGLGSIRQAVDDNAAVVAYSEFDPYGNPIQSGDDPYGFTGEWWQDEIKLLHLRARYYNPAVGRFLTADTVIPNPFGSQDWNRYAYVGNNPVVYVDPSGRCRGLSGAAFDACAAVVMATAAGVHKANEYRNDIFFPDANTTFADRLEAATVIGGGATLVSAVAAGGIALGGSGAVSTVSTSSAAALTGSGVAAAANVIGQAINKAETGERIDTGEVVVAGTIGYMAGALAPVGATTYLGAAALGGLSTVGQYSLTELNRGNACNITPEGVLYNAGLGIFFGGLAGPAPKGYSAFATYADNPAIRNKAIMDIHRSQLAEMVKTSSTSRAVLSGVGTTLNWDRVAERLREFGLIE